MVVVVVVVVVVVIVVVSGTHYYYSYLLSLQVRDFVVRASFSKDTGERGQFVRKHLGKPILKCLQICSVQIIVFASTTV